MGKYIGIVASSQGITWRIDSEELSNVYASGFDLRKINKPKGKKIVFDVERDGDSYRAINIKEIIEKRKDEKVSTTNVKEKFKINAGDSNKKSSPLNTFQNEKKINQNTNQPKSQPKSKNGFTNPYNFVYWMKEAKENTELARQTPRSHLSASGVSGELTCSIHVKSDLFVSGQPLESEHKDHNVYDFYKSNGKFTIPGSTIRGRIRSIYETITNSCYSILEENEKNEPLFYRGPSSMAQELIPARIEVDEEGNFRALLCTGKINLNEKPRVPQYAAWVLQHRWTPANKSKYHTRKHVNVSNLQHGEMVYAILETMQHVNKNGNVDFVFQNVKELKKNINELSDPSKAVQGWYYFSDYNINRKHDERFFYCTTKQYASIDSNRVNKYNLLLENYRELFDNKTIPTTGVKPSRHVVEEDYKLKHGSLVYVKLDPSQRTVSEIYPVMISRKQYSNSVLDLLDPHLHHCKEYEKDNNVPYSGLCPACRLFGWVKGEEVQGDKNGSYKGRITFSDAFLNEETYREIGSYPEETLALLSTPKPTSIPMYLRPRKGDINQLRNNKKGYDEPGVSIRGRKLYLTQTSVYKIKNRDNLNQRRTARTIMKRGNRFSFKIKFNNLSSFELGALIWVLELESNMYHQLGYGKALGMGACTISIDKLRVDNIYQSYQSWLIDTTSSPAIDKANYISNFKEHMKEAFSNQFEELSIYNELKAILSPQNRVIHYPNLNSNTENQNEHFRWFVSNKNNSKHGPSYYEVLSLPTGNETLNYDPKN